MFSCDNKNCPCGDKNRNKGSYTRTSANTKNDPCNNMYKRNQSELKPNPAKSSNSNH